MCCGVLIQCSKLDFHWGCLLGRMGLGWGRTLAKTSESTYLRSVNDRYSAVCERCIIVIRAIRDTDRRTSSLSSQTAEHHRYHRYQSSTSSVIRIPSIRSTFNVERDISARLCKTLVLSDDSSSGPERVGGREREEGQGNYQNRLVILACRDTVRRSLIKLLTQL